MTASLRYAALTAASIVIVVVMTWPLGRVTHAVVPASDDAYFSIWRLAWIAHQLPEDPRHLFDANIFHPARGTLALSDAMLLPGVLGLPMFAAGINPAVTHNQLMLAAFVLSMLCAFALAHRLTQSSAAAWMAAIIFGLAPYRMAHISHLELQWTMWMPLAMLLLHRVIERPAPGRGLLLGAALGAQALSSIYYGVFLACYLAIAFAALVPFEKAKGRIAYATTFAIVPLLVVALIYGPPYSRTQAQFGERRAEEVTSFSAVPSDYLRVPQENVLRGRPGAGEAPDERSLFPGSIAVGLALLAFIPPISRISFTYLGLAIVAADLSFGAHGIVFPLLQNTVSVTGSLRSPARFGVLVLMSIAVLAAIGAGRIYQRWPKLSPLISVALTVLCLAEYWSAPIGVREFDLRPSEVHAWLARQAPGTVVVEMPVPTPSTLWMHEPAYSVQSINHWQPLVNGYSAFPPAHYIRLITELRKFPERDAIVALREAGVSYILLNRRFYDAQAFDRLIAAADQSSRLWPVRSFGTGPDEVIVYQLNYEPE
ncbi:MAG TPA: hypothetical protein VFZ31_12320 [Vicinamibacterales bacterium]